MDFGFSKWVTVLTCLLCLVFSHTLQGATARQAVRQEDSKYGGDRFQSDVI